MYPIEGEKELIRQLPKASKYKATGSGKLLIVPKLEVRKALGCSPDDADSYVNGIYGLQFVTPEEELIIECNYETKGYRDDSSGGFDDPMICC